MLQCHGVGVLLSPVQTEGPWPGYLRETLMLGGSIALYRKINYRLSEQVGLPQSSCPYSKSRNKKFRSHTQNIITGKELLLYNENEGKQMKAKISHVKLMDDLQLHVHPVIANTEPTF